MEQTGELVIRDIGKAVQDGLRARAAARGHSMEEEARCILYDAVLGGNGKGTAADHRMGLGIRIAELFAGLELDDTTPVEFPEWKGELARPAVFDDDEDAQMDKK